MLKNSKALKKLRKAILDIAGHLPVRNLETPHKVIQVPDYSLGLNSTGNPVMVPFFVPLPAKNTLQTQRGMYRHLKKTSAIGSFLRP